MNKISVLIVEDDSDLREALQDTLEIEGYLCHSVENGKKAIEHLKRNRADIVVSDVNMPEMDGHSLLQVLREHMPNLPVILMTAYGAIDQAVDAMQMGAVDYLVKPFEAETLVDCLAKYLNVNPIDLEEPVAVEASSQEVFRLAKKVADTDATILVSGESGTGKEVLARYIHNHSNRAEKPFVAINCAAIPENMLESTLFGFEKGAFTGAYAASPGKFEQANGGTLLLDEISEMDLGLQAKLLRVLQEREVERIGGKKVIPLDVRVIATTNRQLYTYVKEGNFREDLFYRLSVFPLEWKPLRERRGDIVPIAQKLLARHSNKMNKLGVHFDDSAKQVLMDYSWPGNVRELENAIQRALILQQGQLVTGADLSLQLVPQSSYSTDTRSQPQAPVKDEEVVSSQELMNVTQAVSENGLADESSSFTQMNASKVLSDDLQEREVELIIQAIKNSRNKKAAAETLGISPRTLRYKMAKLREQGINLEEKLA